MPQAHRLEKICWNEKIKFERRFITTPTSQRVRVYLTIAPNSFSVFSCNF